MNITLEDEMLPDKIFHISFGYFNHKVYIIKSLFEVDYKKI